MDAKTDAEEGAIDDKELTVLAIWQRGLHVYNIISSPDWQRRHFDELNLPDRLAFVNLCADLALMDDPRAGMLYHNQIIAGLPAEIAGEIGVAVGSAITYRCIENQREAVPVLSLDLMAIHHSDLNHRNAVQAEQLITSLSEKLFSAFLARREHFGFGLDVVHDRFGGWSDLRRDPFLLSLASLVFTEYRKFDDESDREVETMLANEAVEWSMMHLQKRSKAFAHEVRVALGKFIIDHAHQFKLVRLPEAAMTFVVAYLDEACDRSRGNRRRKIIRSELLWLQPELREAIKINLYEERTKKEEKDSDLRSTD